MKAIIDLNGQQYEVTPGQYIEVDLLDQEPEAAITLDKICLVDDGNAVKVGQPYVAGATINAKVMRHYRGPKVLVYKMRCKKGYRRKNGHRQQYTQLMIESVNIA